MTFKICGRRNCTINIYIIIHRIRVARTKRRHLIRILRCKKNGMDRTILSEMNGTLVYKLYFFVDAIGNISVISVISANVSARSSTGLTVSVS